jgi:hypothetical protein
MCDLQTSTRQRQGFHRQRQHRILREEIERPDDEVVPRATAT